MNQHRQTIRNVTIGITFSLIPCMALVRASDSRHDLTTSAIAHGAPNERSTGIEATGSIGFVPSADCNTNGTLDADEIFIDCNTNGIPEECDALINDCNTNGVPDECDVVDLQAVYWADAATGLVQRSNLDGGAVVFMRAGANIPSGVALDVPRRKLYWTEFGDNRIRRSNLDGSALETVLTGLSVPRDLAVDSVHGRVYWTQPATGLIRSANLDGSDVGTVVSGQALPWGLDVDPIGGKVYWSDQTDDVIRRANLDGSSIETIVTIAGGATPAGVALDIVAGKVYWTDRLQNAITRANLDGTSRETVVSSDLLDPEMICIDSAASHIYWTDFGNDTIKRAELDGSNIQTLVTSISGGLAMPRGIDVFPKQHSSDCNYNGIPDECDLVDNDCNSNTVPDDCEFALGDCNSNGILDECESSPIDCNENGLADLCELQSGTPTIMSGIGSADLAGGDEFGLSVAISGSMAIIGARLDDDFGQATGSAYVFRNVGGYWEQFAKLTALDAGLNDQFGTSVAISGNFACVGAPLDDDVVDSTGSAYIFRQTDGAWTQVAKLHSSDPGPADQFGYSVALSGDTAIVGAFRDDDACGGTALCNSGSAFVFREVGGIWQQVGKLIANDAAIEDQLGLAVAISGNTVVVGAPRNDHAGTDCGAAYVFRDVGGNWQQIAKLVALDADANDEFGTAVAISGDTVVVGSYLDDDGFSQTGSAYVFREIGGNWQQIAKITAADAAMNNQFGISVAVRDREIAVGAHLEDTDGIDNGAVYMFREVNGIWQQTAKLKAPTLPGTTRFGASVAMDGEYMIGGAPLWNNRGRAFVFDTVTTSDCNTNGTPDTCELADNDCNNDARLDVCELEYTDCNTNGIPDECELSGVDCNLNSIPDECELESGMPALLSMIAETDSGTNDLFGRTVSIDGNVAAIGSPMNDNSGAAYLFQISGDDIAGIAKLVASDPVMDDRFGWSITLDGDTVIVGAPQNDNDGIDSGCAYVFQNVGGTWGQIAVLTAADAEAGDRFGESVSLNGDVAIISAVGDDAYTGSAYVFRKVAESWQQVAKLTASDAAAADNFGRSVAISGNTALIGAPQVDGIGLDSGAAYVFRETGGTWHQIVKLVPAAVLANDRFGSSVAIDEPFAVISARLDDGVGTDDGSAYIFREIGGEWPMVSKITALDAASNDNFGTTVAIDGEIVIVSSILDDDVGSNSGSVYVFRRIDGHWTQTVKLIAADGSADDQFGRGVAISGDLALIGSSLHDFQATDSGAAYVFDLVTTFDCNTNSIPDNCDLMFNDCNANGVPDECDAINNDCNTDTVPDECEISGNDCDQNGVPDECDPDCNNNGITDRCDIDDLTSADCNTNLFPDECDIALLDCNTNGVPDDCDSLGLPVGEIARIQASDAGINDRFGDDAKISGNTCVIGASYDDDIANNSGAAYVFDNVGGTWHQVAKLKAADPGSSDRLGQSADIDGDTIVVGSYLDDVGGSNAGSAYVFRKVGGTWQQIAKLTASDSAADNHFGKDVAICGDTILIGATGDDSVVNSNGAAYVFREIAGTWQELAKLIPSDVASGDSFGGHLALHDGAAFITSIGDDDYGLESGSVYVFREIEGTWQQLQKLTASDAAAGYDFGDSISVDAGVAVIGAGDSGPWGARTGAAYVFVESGGVWEETAKLTAIDGADSDDFGHGVALSGDTVLIGAYDDDDSGSNSGSAYVFRNVQGIWKYVAKVTASDAAAGDTFGQKVALSGTVAVIGAPDDNAERGSAYIFDLSPISIDCNANLLPDECELNSADANTNGIPDDCEIGNCPTCPGDINGDSIIDGDDIQCFVACVVDGSSANCPNCDCATISIGAFVESLLAAAPACP